MREADKGSGVRFLAADRLEEAVDRFEDAWQRGERPGIDQHLSGAGVDRGALLLELVHVDLEYRLKAGEAALAEAYLERYPELGLDRRGVLELLAAEWKLRRRADPCLSIDEYARRFPGFRDDLLALETVSLAPGGGHSPLHAADHPTPPATPATGPAGGSVGEVSTRSRYRILRMHARGGLGEILRALDEDLHREVALKRLQQQQAGDADRRSRFLREAEITSQLEHPGVVPVYGLGQAADGSPVYAMRLIRGDTFQEAADRFHQADRPGRDAAERRLAFRQLLSRFLSVCNTIAYAHNRGVLHRDVKPGNILLGSYGETLVVDWGLAKSVGGPAAGAATRAEAEASPTDSDLTQAGEVIGTPAYMSPEQAAGRWDEVGPASDVYSLGATLYVLLTGRTPFGPGQVAEVLERVRRSDFPRPRQVCKGVCPALEAVCLKAMAARPEMRYGSALALAADLEQWLAGEPVSARREPVAARVRRWVGRHTALVTAAAVGLAACAVVAVVTALWFAAAAREQAAREVAEVRRKELERADLERYYFHIAAADREWWADRFPEATQHLADCKPELHGWEWNHMARRGRDGESFLTLRGHDKEVWNVAFSPDGGRLASASLDGTVRVWDAADGRRVFTLEGHAGPVWGVAFSPDGALLATGGGDRTVRLWDAKTGRPLRSFPDLPGEVRGLAFSPDGRTLAAALSSNKDPQFDKPLSGGEVWLCDVSTATVLEPLTAPTDGLTSVAFSPDGKTVAAGTLDYNTKTREYQLRWWDAATAKEKEPLGGGRAPVRAVAFSPDGRWLASASNDGDVRIWDPGTGKMKHVLAGHTMAAWGVAFSPDSRRVASSADDTTIMVWDVALGRLLQTLHGHTQGIANVAFSPDGLRLASASDDQTVKVWSVGNSQTALTLCGHKNGVWGVAYSHDGRRVASSGADAPADDAPADDSAVRVWDAGGRQLAALRVPGGSRSVAFSPDDRLLAAAGDDRMIHVWDAVSGWEERILRGHDDKVLCVAFSPDGRLLASASADRTVKLWDVAAGKELFTLAGHGDQVWSVAFSPDGKKLASGGDDKVVKVWDVATGREEQTLTGHPAAVRCVAFSPDGKRLAVATAALMRVLTKDSGEIVVWDLETGQTALTLRGHERDVLAVVYSPDGKRLVSAGSEGWLKLWEPTTGQEILTLYDAHLQCINAVAFSPDGLRLASASCDGTVILHNGAPPE